jgi:hypothetical protein
MLDADERKLQQPAKALFGAQVRRVPPRDVGERANRDPEPLLGRGFQAPPRLPEYLPDPANSTDTLAPAADDRRAAPSSASVPRLPRARRRFPGDGGRRRTHHRIPLLEAQLPVPPRTAAVAGRAGDAVAGGGRGGI